MSNHIKAFPVPYPHESSNRGMDLRDWFAGMALQGFISCGGVIDVEKMVENIYRISDEMMKERSK